MDHIIRRLETIHRALRAAPERFGRDPRMTEAVADCLRELHAIAAQSTDSPDGSRARLRLVDGGPPAFQRRLH